VSRQWFHWPWSVADSVNESNIRHKAKALEQAINAIIANKEPMTVPPDDQTDVPDDHSSAYKTAIENKGLVPLRATFLRETEPYKNWPDSTRMEQALWDVFAATEDELEKINWMKNNRNV
jgi:hypothetical protein